MEHTGNTYVIKNADWNANIKPGEDVAFGMTVLCDGEIVFPENFSFVMEEGDVTAQSYSAEFTLYSDWGTGCNGAIILSNLTDKPIENWQLEFDYDREIVDIANAVIVSHEQGHYVIKNAEYNADIAANSSVHISIVAGEGETEERPENFTMQQTVVGDAVLEDVDKEKDTDGDGLPDYLEEKYCTSCVLKDTDKDGLNDTIEVYYGLNPLKSDSEIDYDEDGLTTEEEIKHGTHIFLDDTDGDDLSDLEEIEVYYTNPSLEDTDGDGLDDGTEVRMGLNPLMSDSDGNGVCDGEQMIAQTIKLVFPEEEKNAILSVEVSMEATGEVDRMTTIKNMYEIDSLSSRVIGLVGVPIEITTKSVFNEATITFAYDENLLGETKEENLRVMWYDEENNQYVILDEESVVDTENNTVCYKTTHFSTYLVVDRQAWYDVWNRAVSYGRQPSSSYPTQYIDLCYVIDKSGSMSGTYMNTAKEAIRNFIEAMYDYDRGAIVGFDSYATLYQDFTSEKNVLTEALKGIYASGGTSVESGLVSALDLFPSSQEQLESGIKNARVILLLCDGDVYYTQSTLDRAKRMGVKIYPVLIGSTYGKAALQTIADTTGGKMYYAANAEEIREAIFGVQEDTVGEIDTTDTDGDGLYDIYETAGMILPNGSYVYTDPTNPDTDGDKISDGEEMGLLKDYIEQMPLKQITLKMMGFDAEVYAEFFDYISDPTVKDSDEDGYDDKVDALPRVKNSDMIYIFYEKGGEWFLENEAKCRKRNYEKEGAEVTVIAIEGVDHFIESWNSMGLNKEGKYLYGISDVYTIFHGNPWLIAINHNKENSADGNRTEAVEYIWISDIDKLQDKKIGVLHLSSCNNGNIDWINYGKWGNVDFQPNMAIQFLKKLDGIEQVMAWDGSAVYADLKLFQFEYSSSPGILKSIVGTGEFLEWSRAKNGYNRWSNGLITYYRDENAIKMSATHKMEYSYSWDFSLNLMAHEIKEAIQ